MRLLPRRAQTQMNPCALACRDLAPASVPRGEARLGKTTGPSTKNDVRAALDSMGIKKICLSQIRLSQPGLVPLPQDMITRDVESSYLLLIKCLLLGEDDSSNSPLHESDGSKNCCNNEVDPCQI